MINRINLILRAKNITARQFAEEIGIQPSGMSHILGGRNNPSLDFAVKVLKRYPEIDANWLLLGKGQMYASALSSAPAPTVGQVEMPMAEPEGVSPQLPEVQSVAEPALNDIILEAQREMAGSPSPYEPSYVAVPPEEVSVDEQEEPDCRAKRIVVIYADGTFEELRRRV